MAKNHRSIVTKGNAELKHHLTHPIFVPKLIVINSLQLEIRFNTVQSRSASALVQPYLLELFVVLLCFKNSFLFLDTVALINPKSSATTVVEALAMTALKFALFKLKKGHAFSPITV